MNTGTKLIYAFAFLAVPAVTHAQAAAANTAASAKRAEMKEERREKKEAHPEIRKAIAALERARTDLQKAANDFGGHKAEAIKSIDEALKHLKLADAYDKK
jgi:hypothetical protein